MIVLYKLNILFMEVNSLYETRKHMLTLEKITFISIFNGFSNVFLFNMLT